MTPLNACAMLVAVTSMTLAPLMLTGPAHALVAPLLIRTVESVSLSDHAGAVVSPKICKVEALTVKLLAAEPPSVVVDSRLKVPPPLTRMLPGLLTATPTRLNCAGPILVRSELAMLSVAGLLAGVAPR